MGSGRRVKAQSWRTAKVEGGAVRRHRPDYHIILFMGIIMLIGLVIMFAIGPQRANLLNSIHGFEYSENYFFVRQLLNLGVAVAAFIAMALIPIRFLEKYAKQILIVALAACALLAILGFAGSSLASCTLGACRWYDLGPLGSIQPAELLKFAILLFGAGFLGVRAKQGLINDKDKTLIPIGIMLAIAIFIVIVLQKDMGTGIALIAIVATMLLVAGLKMRIIMALLAGLVALGMILIITAPHRIARITTFFSGDSSTVDDPGAYHIAHAKIAIGSGGLLGVGIGESVQATGYLPEAINDSVFAIMGETFGFVGLVVVLFLFAALLMRILKVMDHTLDMVSKLVVAGVLGWFASHVLLNVGAMLGLIPLTGITLPLLSFGGTSMLFIAGALGLVFQLSAYTLHGSRLAEIRKGTNESTSSWRGIGRTRNAGSRRITRA